MKKEMKVFKVVNVVDGRYLSAFISQWRHLDGVEKFILEYKVGEWTDGIKQGSVIAPVMAFDNLREAEDFRGAYCRFGKIFSATGRNVRTSRNFQMVGIASLQNFWKMKFGRKRAMRGVSGQTGTLLCHSLRLDKEIR